MAAAVAQENSYAADQQLRHGNREQCIKRRSKPRFNPHRTVKDQHNRPNEVKTCLVCCCLGRIVFLRVHDGQLGLGHSPRAVLSLWIAVVRQNHVSRPQILEGWGNVRVYKCWINVPQPSYTLPRSRCLTLRDLTHLLYIPVVQFVL